MASTTTGSRFKGILAAAALSGLLVAACSGASAQTIPATRPPSAPNAAATATTEATHVHAAATPTATEVAAATPESSATTAPAAPTVAPSDTVAATVAPTTAPATPAATATATARPQSGPVAVTLYDISIKLDRTSAAAGSVTFTIKNSGSVVHQLVVLKTDIPQNQIPVNTSVPGTVSEPGFIAQTPTINPGASATLSLTLGAGSYVLMCNQPAHYLIGMHTAFSIN